jgi:hypothetical protein
MEVNDARRLRLLEDENRKLKKLVADQALDMMVLANISYATRAKTLVRGKEKNEGSRRVRETRKDPNGYHNPRGVFLPVAGVLLTWGGDTIVIGERHSVAMAIIGREWADRGCARVRA